MNKTGLAIALAAAVVAGSAFAGQAPQLMGDQNSDHSGWYVGALAGYGKTAVDNDGYSSAGSKLWSWAAGLNGGYQFNQYIAAEVGGLYFGKVTAGQTSVYDVKAKDNYALYAAAKGILPINGQFDLFGKLGVAAVHTKVDADGSGDGLSYSFEGTQTNPSLLVGLGGEYYFTQNVSVSLEAMYFTKNTSGNGTPDHLVGLAGVAYHF